MKRLPDVSHAEYLISEGADVLILGCSEIPLAFDKATFHGVPLIDPVVMLARALIREAAPGKLKPPVL